MAYLMGIDLGTSSLKTLIVDENGGVAALCSKAYRYDSPADGYAEQDPRAWWDALVETIRAALEKSRIPPEEITGLSFSGQMHGLVALDEKSEPVRKAILHCDVRSAKQVGRMKELLGARAPELMMNPIYTGFLLPSMLWVRENEPRNYERIRSVCLPKDYIKYRITGELSTDYSDASATLAFDIRKNCWSKEILNFFGVPESFFPPCFEPGARVGSVCREAADETGLSVKTAVAAGGGDQVMQGIGNGALSLGAVTANIGSSGQVCFQSDEPRLNRALSTNMFCGYRKGRWISMGAIMHAGLALGWLRSLLGRGGYEELDELAAAARPGSGGVLFLPYLNGERTPHADPELSAAFLGLSISVGRPEMARAVMEGVAFALRQCMETCEELGLQADSVIASGGGARSGLWLQIQSDVYGLPLKVSTHEEQACLGAAIAAGAGAGVYRDIGEGCSRAVRYRDALVTPNEENHRLYLEQYELFKEAYSANGELLPKLTRIGGRA